MRCRFILELTLRGAEERVLAQANVALYAISKGARDQARLTPPANDPDGTGGLLGLGVLLD